MEVTGTVTYVRRRPTDYGSLFLTVQIDESRFTYLHGIGAGPIPSRGQHVTLTGVPMITSGRHRGIRTNIGAARLAVHEDSGQPETGQAGGTQS